MRLATLGMYDFGRVAPANDVLWTWLAERLGEAGLAEVPDHLDRSRPASEIIRDTALLLGQTCGYPLMTSLRDQVQIVATPSYDLPGCEGSFYRSFLLVADHAPLRRIEDLRGKIAAVNGLDSNSGMNVLRGIVAPHATSGQYFGDVMITGGHLSSIAAIASGFADVAAIDCVTYGLATRHAPDVLAGTRILAWTETTPGLPLVTGPHTTQREIAALRNVLLAAVTAPELAETRDTLALAGLEILDSDEYGRILDVERRAAALGYPVLA